MEQLTVLRGDSSKSDYTVRNFYDVICIEDLDCGGLSVTDNAEDVVREIQKLGYNTERYPIIYKDAEGTWDRIVLESGEFSGFKPLGHKDLKDALMALFENLCAEMGIDKDDLKKLCSKTSSHQRRSIYEKFESEP